jgi:hypothetical protein
VGFEWLWRRFRVWLSYCWRWNSIREWRPERGARVRPRAVCSAPTVIRAAQFVITTRGQYGPTSSHFSYLRFKILRFCFVAPGAALRV